MLQCLSNAFTLASSFRLFLRRNRDADVGGGAESKDHTSMTMACIEKVGDVCVWHCGACGELECLNTTREPVAGYPRHTVRRIESPKLHLIAGCRGLSLGFH